MLQITYCHLVLDDVGDYYTNICSEHNFYIYMRETH